MGMLIDDDSYIQPLALASALANLSVSRPICAGHMLTDMHAEGIFGYGLGIACNSAAMRRLHPYLENNALRKAFERWIFFEGDTALDLCMRDLGISRVSLGDHNQ